MEQIRVLDVRIDVLKKEHVRDTLRRFLLSQTSHTVFTPNPEMLVSAYQNEEVKDVLNTSDLNICDGFGITFVSSVSKKVPTIPRYPGSDCMVDLCETAGELGKSVYLLGGKNEETLRKAKVQLEKRFPNLRVAGFHSGVYITRLEHGNFSLSEDKNNSVIDAIIDAAPDILFVGFGHGKQEWWINKYIKELPSVKIAMGIGGSIDSLAAGIRRGPRLLRRLGLEWVWRLICEPWRIKRIFTATILFPYIYFFKQHKR